MTLKIDSVGRIVLPKQIRDRLGLRANSEVEVVYQPDGVLLKPDTGASSFSMENGLLIHHGSAEKNANWDSVLDDLREERIRSTH